VVAVAGKVSLVFSAFGWCKRELIERIINFEREQKQATF
jgi:hypothetical protein